MEYLVNAREMKNCDKNTIEFYKMPSEVLMERAALAVVEKIRQQGYDTTHVLAVCGNGNNGGDGVAAARILCEQGVSVSILLVDQNHPYSDGMQKQLSIAESYGMHIINEWEDVGYTLILDAIFGIGLSRQIEGKTAELIRRINEAKAPVVAVDIASGISADNGNILGCAVKADMTVTFAFKKLGQLLYPGADHTGRLFVCDIGITKKSWLGKKPSYFAMEKEDLKFLPKRENHSNKGSYGKVLLIAGSANMGGAAVFASAAAYASGCGLVKVFTAEENRTALLTHVPEAILSIYAGKKLDRNELIESIKWADVVAIGPGIGTEPVAREMVKTVLEAAAVPVVMDADALNILSEDINLLLRPHTEIIVTPHPSEMARLAGASVSYIKDNLIMQAEEFAREYNVICVLKDARTVCAIPYGKTYLNLSGNHGMATAGSGDVLCGLIAGLTAQGVRPELAAPLGVYIHGLSGDVMVKRRGYHGLMAGDLPDGIKKVMKKLDYKNEIEDEKSEDV